MAKKSKIEKETRRIIESISELIKKRGNRYKFKIKKKKQVKEVKRTCVHWVMRKGKSYPAVVEDVEHPGNWKCSICGSSFPVKPDIIYKDSNQTQIDVDNYREVSEKFISHVNQLQFYSVMMGGDSSDTKMFITLRKLIPRYMKVQRNIIKAMDKRDRWEKRKDNKDSMSSLEGFGSNFSYNP